MTNATTVMRIWMASGLPRAVSELRFHPKRLWRFDYAWPVLKIAVEVQGGIWIRGRHTRGAALKKEWDKLNAAAVTGWRILYCEPRDVCSTKFIETLGIMHLTNFLLWVDLGHENEARAEGHNPDSVV